MRQPPDSTAICAEPSTWPAGWKLTVTPSIVIRSPSTASCIAPAKPTP